jgi:hypothetical protein
MCFMTYADRPKARRAGSPAYDIGRCQVLGKEVRSLCCPRNGKREKHSFMPRPVVANEPEGGMPCLASPETGLEASSTT